MSHTLVFDIGKTHAKALVFDDALVCVHQAQRASAVLAGAPYPRLDVAGLWEWMLQAMREASRFPVTRLNVSAHGATAALVDPACGDTGLVLPVLDYEFDVAAAVPEYETRRPTWQRSLSPSLPLGLNLGRQLWWLQREFPAEFSRATAILMYPQYWTWRLSGARVSECTSLGCHTDLWDPRAAAASSLARETGWAERLPRLLRAWEPAGPLRPELVQATGLAADCAVYAGVHDSNAGYARHLHGAAGAPFVLISTGTWVITMASGANADRLDPARDMLANVDVCGEPVPCARFMGGREFARICQLTAADPQLPVTLAQVQQTMDAGEHALPGFGDGSGPCGGRAGRLPAKPAHGAALATLYLALMIEWELELLGAAGEVMIEGAFAANPVLCALVAGLLDRPVYLSGAAEATATGAAMLCRWSDALPGPTRTRISPAAVRGLAAYRARWREAIDG